MEVIKNKFRLVKLDQWNYTFETFIETKDKDGNSKGFSWVRSTRYYVDIPNALQGLKSALKNECYEDKLTIEEYIKRLNEIDIKVTLVSVEKEKKNVR